MGWKQKLATSVISREVLSQVKSEPRLIWARLLCFMPANLLKIRRLKKINTSLSLNLGSGPHQMPGWLSVDLFPPKSGVRWDLRWKLPFEDSSVTRIHCEHFLEHIEYQSESLPFLKECARVLTETGELNLIVPDAAKYIDAYAKKDKQFFTETSDLGGAVPSFTTEIEIINQAFRMGGGHKFLYDWKTLSHQLTRAGFFYSKLRDPGSSMDLPDRWRILESMYVTAAKRQSSSEIKKTTKKLSRTSTRVKKVA